MNFNYPMCTLHVSKKELDPLYDSDKLSTPSKGNAN